MPTSTKPSIKVLKTITFRGAPRVYTNRYFFTGPVPADATHWTTLSDAIVTAEKAVHHSTVTITGTYGYAAGSDVPVFSKTYATVGTMTAAGGGKQTGEVAALARWSTSVRSSKNHPVYLYSYYHAVYNQSGTGWDLLDTAQRSAMQTYAALWISGFSDGTTLNVRCSPTGHQATGATVDQYLTHRDFPRG